MNENVAHTIREKLPALQQAYLKRLQNQLPELKRLRAEVAGGAMTRADLQLLHRMGHNFKGSGSTLGFHDISTTARAIDDTLKQLNETGIPPDIGELTAQCDAFLEACEAAIRTVPLVGGTKRAPQPISLGEEDGGNHVVIYTPTGEAVEMMQQLKRFGYQPERVFDVPQFTAATQLPIHAAIIYSDLAEADHGFIRTACDGALVIVISNRTDFDARLTAVRLGAAALFVEAELDILKVMDKIEQLTAHREPSPHFHVLIVEDDEVLGQLYAHTLQDAGMMTSLVTSPQEALRVVQEQAIDILLIDFTMPLCDGGELAAIIRQHDRFVRLPIIFMSAKEDLERRLINAGLGIDDYLVKPFSPEQLLSVVRSRGQRAAELRNLMVRDSFTGLYNHAQFIELLEREVATAERTGIIGVHAVLDLDHFKRINDTYGHAAGDQVIRALARLLQQRLRRSDIIGRCGGEEFGILMPGCSLEHAERILQSLRENFAATPFHFNGQLVHATFSAGAALMDGRVPAEQLVSQADHALYRAKQAGRNQLMVA